MRKSLLALLSLLIVGFGQPAYEPWLALLAAVGGYAMFWSVLIEEKSAVRRFIGGMIWFALVQAIQLSWSLSHPYVYIYAVYLFYCLGFGLQFGILCYFVRKETVEKFSTLLAIAGLWTILEWSRLFFLSGMTWNPVGLALSGSVYSLQMASIWGVYGLSFWVIFVNLLVVRARQVHFTFAATGLWAACAALPYLFGAYQITAHDSLFVDHHLRNKPYSVALVQTGFEVEEAAGISDRAAMIAHTLTEWEQILKIMKRQEGKALDLIVMPEGCVPCGAYSFLYPAAYVQERIVAILGPDARKALPPLMSPLSRMVHTEQGEVAFVNNAYWSQALANYFNASLIIGLEDVEEDAAGMRQYFSSAFHFSPQNKWEVQPATQEDFYKAFKTDRYDKRVLVPMGEYIPFEFCRELASQYGVTGSYAFGKEAKVVTCAGLPLTLSICYEETFGNMMRESRALGAELIVNLTNDAWFPNSRLPQQHFDHARLRTVESGVPLIRACNTGLTGAVDSLGRAISLLGAEEGNYEWISDVLHVELTTYTYQTLYARTGDTLIMGIAALFLPLLFWERFRRK